jgi:hypothetical protein
MLICCNLSKKCIREDQKIDINEGTSYELRMENDMYILNRNMSFCNPIQFQGDSFQE